MTNTKPEQESGRVIDDLWTTFPNIHLRVLAAEHGSVEIQICDCGMSGHCKPQAWARIEKHNRAKLATAISTAALRGPSPSSAIAVVTKMRDAAKAGKGIVSDVVAAFDVLLSRLEGLGSEPPKECTYCDSTDLSVCSYCFDKPTQRAKARGEECARLIAERDAAVSERDAVLREVREALLSLFVLGRTGAQVQYDALAAIDRLATVPAPSQSCSTCGRLKNVNAKWVGGCQCPAPQVGVSDGE